ncbi:MULTISPECIES: hypothetical protein [unclassified Pseudodesulfovibrio]|uniref:hypothetical protein n=1 Tax=unclassified Pseudodesulfovibrio TaxID=2661612 RepID=UPI000FEBD1DF|nr:MULTISPECIES: hypothetical protein [unclassified Pseudodesulfovibrio]MCJ2166194.1 hypothetical protein [Pseudodesulfovibrio sp. S3-i]
MTLISPSGWRPWRAGFPACQMPGEIYFLDVIEPSRAAMALAEKYVLEQVFVMVRITTGPEPDMDKGKLFGVTSFELG